MTEHEIRNRLIDRFAAVESRIQAACQRSGRNRTDVQLIAVTKSVNVQVIEQLVHVGVTDVAESRPQQLNQRYHALQSLPYRWHMIGHLQRNKVPDTLECNLSLIHSVDSERLLAAIQAECLKQQRIQQILLEVNVSREPAKHGFTPEELPGIVEQLEQYSQVQVIGLMAMAAIADTAEQTRPTFRELAELAAASQLKTLSMGMSDDFEVAIEEGATMIRLGSVLFEGF